MKRLVLLTVAFAGLAACDTPSAPAEPGAPSSGPSFAVIFNERESISGVVTDNTCPGAEPVAFEASSHVLVTGERTPTSSDIKFHINAAGVGVGLISGDRYILVQNNKAEFVTSAAGPTVDEEFDVRFRMIRQGSEDNFWLRLTFHFTSPPPTTEIIRDDIECRG